MVCKIIYEALLASFFSSSELDSTEHHTVFSMYHHFLTSAWLMLTVLTGADKIASTDTFLDVCPSVVHCTLAIDILSTGLLSTPGTEQGLTRIKRAAPSL